MKLFIHTSDGTSFRRPFGALVFTLLIGLGSACDGIRETASVDDNFLVPIGDQSAYLELALTVPEKRKGLQKRDQLGANDGMAFLYERPQKASFWMKDTFIPLDIGFFTGDGILREVHQLLPNVEVPVQSFRDDIVIAVEMNTGWFQSKGIGPGDRIDLAALTRAIRDRGVDPDIFAALGNAEKSSQ